MATMNAAEVGIGAANATGAIWVAPATATPPTTASAALPSDYKLLGFTSDAGVTISESRSTNKINAWEGRTTVYEVVTEYSESIAFTPIQINGDVAKLIWGDSNVTVATSSSGSTISINHHGKALEPVSIVIDTVPRSGIVRRYVGIFQLSERGQITNDGTQVDARQLTFTAIANANGVTMSEYIAITA